MIGVTERITTPGRYGALVSCALVREALNLQGDFPTDEALKLRIAEAARRIEGLTRLCLPASEWEYLLEADAILHKDFRPNVIFLPGLFAVGAEPSVAVTDPDGQPLPVTSTVRGHGDLIQIQAAQPYREHGFPVKIVLERGVSGEQLPEDLRSAIVTQVEMLIDGFSPLAEASIVRTCSRWGWAG